MLQRTLSVISFFIAATASLAAGDISLTQRLERASISYEDSVLFEIDLSWTGPQWAYRFDRPLELTLDKLRIRQFSSSLESSGDSAAVRTTKRFTYVLVPTGGGHGSIEPMVVSYLTWPDSLPGELFTQAATVNIAAPRPRPTGPQQLLGFPVKYWLVAGPILLLGLAVLMVVIFRNRRPKPVVQTPAQQFLERLTVIREEAGDDLKRFQTGLYKSLLAYLLAEYKVNLAGRPVQAIMKEIDHINMPLEHQEKICAWLLRADREKFSPAEPVPGATIRLETEVRHFFESITTPKS